MLNDVPRKTFCSDTGWHLQLRYCAGPCSKGFSLKLNVGNKIKCPGRLRMNTALIRSDCKAILMSTSYLWDSQPVARRGHQGFSVTPRSSHRGIFLTILPLKLTTVSLPNIVCNRAELFVRRLNIVWEPDMTPCDTRHVGLTLWHYDMSPPDTRTMPLAIYISLDHLCHSQSGILSFQALS